MNQFLILLSWFFFIYPYTNAASHNIVDSYFTLEGNVSPSCYKSLGNSLSAIPLELRKYLSKEIQGRGSKYIFKRESFEAAQKMQFSGGGGAPGVPVYFADATTIYILTDSCSSFNRTITHEIGHLIHSSIQINYPAMDFQWLQLWHDIFKKHGSPQNPLLNFPCPPNNCPFISRKGTVDEKEGFAELVVEGSRHKTPGTQNTHPDYLRQMKFLERVKRRQQ